MKQNDTITIVDNNVIMEPLTSFTISVAANVLTTLLPKLFQKGLDAKLKKAYERALKKWTKHDVGWKIYKYRERLVDLVDYMQNPTRKQRYDSDIELLGYYKDELRKDPEVWSLIEESLLTTTFSLLQDTNRLTQEIKAYLDQCRISQKEFEDSINRLLGLQLRRNIISGKYLEDTYLEVDDLKEQLRFFVDPFVFFKLIRERTERLSFEYLNWKLTEQKNEDFVFDAKASLGNDAMPIDFELLYEAARKLTDYLSMKYDELYRGGNVRYLNSRKIKDILDLNKCIDKRLFILTSKAGQGKTNLLCDLTKNVLQRRGIPAAYLNGYELDANDVEGCFSHKLFASKNYSLDDILIAARCYCEQNQVPFVFIVDGLNENDSPRQLQASMETFLSTIMQYDFVKVIVSCRTEYYDTHFSALGELFANETIIQKNINSRLDDYWEKLQELYFKHFSIRYADITDHIKKEFCENLLLFRIFCEVNEGKNLSVIHSIAKEPLFSAYCEKMITRIAVELKNEGCSLASETFISDFLKDIVERMVENDAFANMPLSMIWTNTDIQQREIINRFLDNNVLVRKDLMSESTSPFVQSEVVNFTYDEFRDYLVSHYIVDIILSKSQEDFGKYVVKYTDKTHLLSEGLCTFLFSYIKRIKTPFALKTIQSLPWYNSVFRIMIWDVDEKNITDDDIKLIKEFLAHCDVTVSRNLVYWGRWDTNEFKRLNINLLLEHLSTLNCVGLSKFFDKTWSNIIRNPYTGYYGYHEKSPRERFIDSVSELLENETHSLEHPQQANIFEVVLYMASCDTNARFLYEDYLKYTKEKEQVMKVTAITQCDKLKDLLNRWL